MTLYLWGGPLLVRTYGGVTGLATSDACDFPDHPGACYDPSCGSPPPLPFSIQINNSPY